MTLRKEKGDGLSRPLISRMAQVGAGGYYPVAVPGVRLADGAAALHTDRGHSLPSLHPPPAAVGSLPLHSPNKSSKKVPLRIGGRILTKLSICDRLIVDYRR